MFTVLKVRVRGEVKEFEMPGATTVEYAAMRVAEDYGYDPTDGRFVLGLALATSHEPLDPQMIVADISGPVECYRRRRR